ncbi:MAG: hypothetical protein RJA22_112 [Verrucomicrobiota bacterium]|jgi:hypothetical protein
MKASPAHPLALALALAATAASPALPAAEPARAPGASLLIVVGAPGEEEFGQAFAAAARRWETAGQAGGARSLTVGLAPTNGAAPDRDRLQQALAAEPKDGPAELWIVLLGHGTWDGKEARFNLRGSDLTATELSAWLKPFTRPIALLNTASASAPFLNKLTASNRVVITATRSGSEVNYTRLGRHLSEAIADPAADLDKDGQTSLLEAFLAGSARVAEFYQSEGRLASEHALLDDNGDGLGTPPDWFRGVRATKRARNEAALDGLRAHQFHLVRSPAEQQLSPETRARRDTLELAIARLRDQKAQLPEADYYRQLEAILLDLARLYDAAPAPARP